MDKEQRAVCSGGLLYTTAVGWSVGRLVGWLVGRLARRPDTKEATVGLIKLNARNAAGWYSVHFGYRIRYLFGYWPFREYKGSLRRNTISISRERDVAPPKGRGM